MSTQLTANPALPPLTVFSPISGQIIPLELVPDPVFAEKLVGDGVSIDPTQQVLHSPIDGDIVQLAKTNHAVTIRAENGLELLLHIGIDTVMLKGEGFIALVGEGDTVSKGQPLIEFDADFIARNAKALMTEVIVSNGEAMNSVISAVSTDITEEQEPLFTVSFGEAVKETDVAKHSWLTGEKISLPNPNGLHARPAATIAKRVKDFNCIVDISFNNKRVSAKSITGILSLGTKLGDLVQLHANGPDAEIALSSLAQQIRDGSGEGGALTSSDINNIQWDDEPSLLFPPNTNDDLLRGVCASAGIAIGVIHQLEKEKFEIPQTKHSNAVETALLDDALSIAVEQLQSMQGELKTLAPEKSKIFNAHEELLSDPALIDPAYRLISEGQSAAKAWHESLHCQIENLQSLDNTLLAERAADLQDVGHRVLRLLLGMAEPELSLPENCIVVAEDLTPSDTARLDKNKVLGFVTVGGGATSHTAIIARSMNLPAMTGIEPAARYLANGTTVILNSTDAELHLSPTDEDILGVKEKIQIQDARRKKNLADHSLPAMTTDHVNIEVVANVGSVKEAQRVSGFGGQGVGLLRSEFLFMNRASAPGEQDQFETYKAASAAIGHDRPLIIRTLDVGGDKPLSYLPLPVEDNPFLGERGIRVSLDKPALFRQQVRALLRAAEFGNIHILLPMISDLLELQLAKQVIEEERLALHAKKIPVGVMIEVPSAAVMADVLAPEVDFFSVGTNDLTQYTLAMDRGHHKLASLADALHPGVLRLIKMTVDAAHKHGKWVGVCGGVAGDVMAVPLLIGLGVKELSVSVPSIPDIKACIRELNNDACRQIAEQSLRLSTAQQVRDLLKGIPLSQS